MGFVPIPLGVLIRCIPTPPLERAFIKLGIMDDNELLPTSKPDTAEWSETIAKALNNSLSPSRLRGGGINTSTFTLKSKKLRIPKKDRATP